MTLVDISRALAERVAKLRFADPVCCVYNPLEYARAPHELYLSRYGGGRKEVLLLGMNPGPFGMAQTGVPFGDVTMVRDWLGIVAARRQAAATSTRSGRCSASIAAAPRSAARGSGDGRAIASARRSASSSASSSRTTARSRSWSRARANRTPDKLPAAEQQALFGACDEALRDVVRLLRPRIVVGVGGFAERRARVALAGQNVAVGTILHPSPASPLANRGWAKAVEAQLQRLGIEPVDLR